MGFPSLPAGEHTKCQAVVGPERAWKFPRPPHRTQCISSISCSWAVSFTVNPRWQVKRHLRSVKPSSSPQTWPRILMGTHELLLVSWVPLGQSEAWEWHLMGAILWAWALKSVGSNQGWAVSESEWLQRWSSWWLAGELAGVEKM